MTEISPFPNTRPLRGTSSPSYFLQKLLLVMGLRALGRKAAWRRPCQGQRHNAFGHFWAQRGNARGPVLSRRSPATPSSPNRSCQRQISVLALPMVRVISAVPSEERSFARQTCFCGLLRIATTDSSSFTQLNVGSFVHSSNSHTRVRQRIPKRIEMSDLVLLAVSFLPQHQDFCNSNGTIRILSLLP